MKKLVYFASVLAIAATTLVQTGCKKDNDIVADNEMVSDNNSTEAEFDDLSSIEQDLMDKNEESLDGRTMATIIVTYPNGVRVTIDNVAKTIVVDFSPNGTATTDSATGRQRKGKVNIAYTARLRNQGAVITTTFDNYYVKGPAATDFTKVEGTKKMTNLSVSSGVYSFKREVTNGKLTFPNSQTFTWNATRYIDWNSNNTFTNRWDDIFTQKTNSVATGTDRRGQSFSFTVTKDVVVKNSCMTARRFRPVSGTVEIIPGDRAKRVIDYGNGDCDNTFTVTVNGRTYTITQN
jgi:hypothetical protein